MHPRRWFKIYEILCNNFHQGYDNRTLLFFELPIVHTIILCSAATLREFLEQIFE